MSKEATFKVVSLDPLLVTVPRCEHWDGIRPTIPTPIVIEYGRFWWRLEGGEKPDQRAMYAGDVLELIMRNVDGLQELADQQQEESNHHE